MGMHVAYDIPVRKWVYLEGVDSQEVAKRLLLEKIEKDDDILDTHKEDVKIKMYFYGED
tara:strand:+ start:1482 stop:1658 length:177 start_codon:yes stop_codon:yes gene_type:complete